MEMPPPLPSLPEAKKHKRLLLWLLLPGMFVLALGIGAGGVALVQHIATENQRPLNPMDELPNDVVPSTNTESSNYKAGYAVGKSQGEEWASLGQGVATARAMELIADGQFNRAGKGDSRAWKAGFRAGYDDGFYEAKRTWRPATASSDKYDQVSYWVGYKAGFGSTHIAGDERTRMFRRSDLEIETHHYKKDDYGAGFAAGEADADKQDEQKKVKQAEKERRDFERKSYEAGYRAEKEIHKHNGVARNIEESIEFNREAQKWDRKSWSAGYSAAQEEDTRP